MGLIAGILFAVVFGFIFSEGWEGVGDFLVMFILALSLVALAYGAFWLMGQLET